MPSDCLFCRMATGETPVEKLYEDDLVFSIRDIHPRAPVHVMIIPKEHIPTMRDIQESHGPLLGRLFVVASKVAEQVGVADEGYRLAFNVGGAAGMTIPHVHLHLLGGRRLGPEG
jgi:histidine triad (HIT) family protein